LSARLRAKSVGNRTHQIQLRPYPERHATVQRRLPAGNSRGAPEINLGGETAEANLFPQVGNLCRVTPAGPGTP